MADNCAKCQKPAGTLALDGDVWVCRHCYLVPEDKSPYFKQMGVENPADPKGSTAHVRDIKARRLDTKTNKMFYYTPPKTYFY